MSGSLDSAAFLSLGSLVDLSTGSSLAWMGSGVGHYTWIEWSCNLSLKLRQL